MTTSPIVLTLYGNSEHVVTAVDVNECLVQIKSLISLFVSDFDPFHRGAGSMSIDRLFNKNVFI